MLIFLLYVVNNLLRLLDSLHSFCLIQKLDLKHPVGYSFSQIPDINPNLDPQLLALAQLVPATIRVDQVSIIQLICSCCLLFLLSIFRKTLFHLVLFSDYLSNYSIHLDERLAEYFVKQCLLR